MTITFRSRGCPPPPHLDDLAHLAATVACASRLCASGRASTVVRRSRKRRAQPGLEPVVLPDPSQAAGQLRLRHQRTLERFDHLAYPITDAGDDNVGARSDVARHVLAMPTLKCRPAPFKPATALGRVGSQKQPCPRLALPPIASSWSMSRTGWKGRQVSTSTVHAFESEGSDAITRAPVKRSAPGHRRQGFGPVWDQRSVRG